ncbi:MAG TPA: cell division protein FtsA [Bryobacteraceae bacterium]|nr:cell division protein FtsA [Bryobacteraceae bacterium]
MSSKDTQLQLAVGLDVGAHRARAVVCALENGALRYLSHGLAPAAGWSKGRIVDQGAVAESIHAAVVDAERGAGVPVDAATLGVGGMEVRGAQSRGLYEFGRCHEVDVEDLEYAVSLASEVRLERGRMLLHALPQDFTLDGRAGFRKPERSVCKRLEANVHIVTADLSEHHALVAAAHRAHLAVEETVFEPMAAAYACIRPEARAKGAALVDFGLHSTDLVVYDGDALLLAASIPVWADHMTRDIATIFKVTYEDAECLKHEYGCALLGLTSDSTLIEVPSPEGRPSREARRSELIEILEARAEEVFLYVRSELERVGMERTLYEGILLAGGGALLPGMCDMAERILNCPAANALATEQDIGGWPEELKTPAWTAAAGLAMYSAKLKLHKPPRRLAAGLMGMVLK